jgi:DNA (cytosine-5)-methyltransferase 1
VFFRLVKECRFRVIFGEQVPAAIGKHWLDGVFADLEAEGYACGAVVLGAHSVNSPHRRQRIYWMADPNSDGSREGRINNGEVSGLSEAQCESEFGAALLGRGGDACRMVQSIGAGLEGHSGDGNDGDESGRVASGEAGSTTATGDTGGLANSISLGRERRKNPGRPAGKDESIGREGMPNAQCCDDALKAGFWDNSHFILCRDGKHRRVPVESEIQPLASRLPYKLGRRRSARNPILRGAGNSIIPQVAAEFIKAYLDIES